MQVSLPPNAIISLPPSFSSLSTRNVPINKDINCFMTSEPVLGSHQLQTSILFTNKPVIILQEDASLLSRVLGHREYHEPLTSRLMQQHSSTSSYNLGPGHAGVCLDQQLPSLTFQPNYPHSSFPEITEIVEDSTKPASDNKNTLQQTAIKPCENESSDLHNSDITSSFPESPSLSKNSSTSDIVQQSSSNRLEFITEEATSSTTSRPKLEAVEFSSLKSKTPYFCEEREKEILQPDSDSELDLSEPQQDLKENQQHIASPHQPEELPLCNTGFQDQPEELPLCNTGLQDQPEELPLCNTGLQDQLEGTELSPHTSQDSEVREVTQTGCQPELDEPSTQQLYPVQQHDEVLPIDEELSNDVQIITSNENESPDSVGEPPLKRQRLSNELDVAKNESQGVAVDVSPVLGQGDCEPLCLTITEHMVSPVVEHDKQSSSVHHSVSLEYPREPTDAVDDGRDTVDQMLPTESAREHAFILKPVHCRPDRSPGSNNDRDDPTGSLSLSKDNEQDSIVLDNIAQVPCLQQEEMSRPNMTVVKVLSLQRSPYKSISILPQEMPQISKYNNSEDCQIVPEDSLDNPFNTGPLYSDIDETKNKHNSQAPCYEIDLNKNIETDGITAPDQPTHGVDDGECCSKRCGAVLPRHSFGWKTNSVYGSSWQGSRGTVQTQSKCINFYECKHITNNTHSHVYTHPQKHCYIMGTPHAHTHAGSETFPVTRLNLTKPYLRLGLSRKQRCKPLHITK